MKCGGKHADLSTECDALALTVVGTSEF